MKPTCSLTNCAKPAHVRGWCQAHYARVLRYGAPDSRPRRKTLLERALDRVAAADADSCWAWTGGHDQHGYGTLRHASGNAKAHRLVYEALIGPIPDGLVIDHMCHNRWCVNPQHLRPVTQRMNVENFTTPTRADNTTGFRGVYLHKASGLYHARAKHCGVVHSGGYFKTAAEAGDAAKSLRLRLHALNDMDRV